MATIAPASTEPARPRRIQRFGLLLAALVTTLLVQGVAPPGDVTRIIANALVAATLVLALRAGDVRRAWLRAATVAAATLVVATAIQAAAGGVDQLWTGLADTLLVALAPPAVAVGVVRALRRHQRIPSEAVVGVVCLYLLFGMFFAFLWGVLDRVDAPFFAGGQAASGSDCLYFSFVTLTTVGYGDVTARTPVGHTFAVLEALIGQIYLVTVVSLIVSNVGRGRALDR
jgi:hypothetical protein